MKNGRINLLVGLLGLVFMASPALTKDNTPKYENSHAEKSLEIYNIAALQELARENMKKYPTVFANIAGGADDGQLVQHNLDAWNKIQIVPRVLQNIKSVNTEASFLGTTLKSPVIIAPMGGNRLMHDEGEKDIARGAGLAGSMYSISTYASFTIEDITKSAPNVPFLFQLYMNQDDGFNEAVLKKAKAAGAKAIVLTADTIVPGNRARKNKDHFVSPFPRAIVAEYYGQDETQKNMSKLSKGAKRDLSLADIKKIKKMSGLPVIVKGIQDPDDAVAAIKAGADGIWVSNHGGRQLGGAPASIEVLPDIAKAVNHRVPIIFDSGVTYGNHVFKAIASGADIVAIGRPALYALNLGGAPGVASLLAKYNKELESAMFLTGSRDIEAVHRAKLRYVK